MVSELSWEAKRQVFSPVSCWGPHCCIFLGLSGVLGLCCWLILEMIDETALEKLLIIFSIRCPSLLRLPLVAQMVKNLPCSAGDVGSIPESGRSLGEGNGYPLHILARRIPWTEEPGI